MIDLFCDKILTILIIVWLVHNPIKAAVQAHERQLMDRRQNLNQRKLFDDKAMNIGTHTMTMTTKFIAHALDTFLILFK